MAHMTSIGAAMFSDISVSAPATPPTAAILETLNLPTEFSEGFKTKITAKGTRVGSWTAGAPSTASAGTTFISIGNVRSFPAIGTPANIVKVPTYGQKTSQSIQGQSDAPQLELDINYLADTWSKGTGATYVGGDSVLGWGVGSGEQFLFRFALLMDQPVAASFDAGTFGVNNSLYYWYGKMEALLVTPSLTDAATAKLTMSIQSPFYGAFTTT